MRATKSFQTHLSESLKWRQGVSRCIWFIWYQEGLARSMLFCKKIHWNHFMTTSSSCRHACRACSFAAFPAAVWQPSKQIKPGTWLPVDRGTPTSMCVLVVYMFFLRTKKNSGWKIEGSTKQVGQQQNFIGNKHPAFFFAVKKHRRSPRNHKRRSSAGRPACPAGHIWGEESGWGSLKNHWREPKWLRTPRHQPSYYQRMTGVLKITSWNA